MGVTRNLKILLFDIETSLGTAYFFSPKVRFITHKMVKEDPHMLCWAGAFIGEKKMHSSLLTEEELANRDDSRIVRGLADLIQEADYVVAHNGDNFDLPWVRGRMWANGMDDDPLGPVQTIDTKKAAAKDFQLTHNNLDHLARLRGYGQKEKTDIGWWIEIAEGNYARLKHMQRYNRRDVRILREVFESMMPHMDRLPRLTVSTEGFACPWCGNTKLEKRGQRHNAAYSYQRYWCVPEKGGCGRYPKERRHDQTNRSNLRAN